MEATQQSAFQPAKRQRLGTPDLLKGVAVILMIQVHIMELFARSDVEEGLFGKISLFLGGPPAAPVFMAAMGFLLVYTRKSPQEMIYRGFRLIAGGLLLNLGLNTHVLFKIFFGTYTLNPWEFVFGVDILFLAGLSMMVTVGLKSISKDHYLPALSFAIFVPLITPHLPILVSEDSALKYLQAFFWGDYSWSYFPLFPWLAYPLIGYAFGLAQKKIAFNKITIDKRLIILVLLGIGFAFTASYATDVATALTEYYHHGFLYFLWVVLFLVMWLLIFSLLENDLGDSALFSYLKWMGKKVTAAYVFQWLIIGNIATAIYKTQNLTEIILWFFSVLLLTSVLIFLWTKFKDHIFEENLI